MDSGVKKMVLHVDPIHVNLEDAWERAFADWYPQNRGSTKAALMCGYFVLSQGIPRYCQISKSTQDARIRLELDAKARQICHLQKMLETLETSQVIALRKDYELRLNSAAAEAADLRNRLKSEVKEAAKEQARVMLLEKELSMAAQMQEVKVNLGVYQHMYAELQETLHGSLAATQQAQEAALKKRIDQLESELAIVKKSNAGRGNLGEFTMASWLRHAFPAAEVRDTSGMPASCDIALVLDADTFHAIEVKNKACIVADDLKKFYRDVDSLAVQEAGRFVGAAFVSLRSRGIPTKGSLHFEVRRGRPLLFVAFDSEDAFDGQLLKATMSILMQASQHLKLDAANSATGLQDLCRQMVPLCQRIGRLRKDVDRIRDSAKDIIKVSTGMAEEVGSILATMQEMARDGVKNGVTQKWSLTGVQNRVTDNGVNKEHPCAHCQGTFATAKGLAQHVRRVHG